MPYMEDLAEVHILWLSRSDSNLSGDGTCKVAFSTIASVVLFPPETRALLPKEARPFVDAGCLTARSFGLESDTSQPTIGIGRLRPYMLTTRYPLRVSHRNTNLQALNKIDYS